MRKISLIIASILTVLIFASCGGPTSSPSKAAEGYFNALKSGDITKALTFTNIPEDEQKQTAEMFSQFNVKLISYSIGTETIEPGDTTATVKVKSTMTSAFNAEPSESEDDMHFVKVNGEWKMVQ